MKHLLAEMAGYTRFDDLAFGAWVVARRKLWTITLRVPIAIPAGFTLDVDLETSPTGEFDGEETVLDSFAQVTPASGAGYEEVLTSEGTPDFAIVPPRDLYLRANATLSGSTNDEVYFEIEADGKWLDVTDADDKALLRSRLQKQQNLAERLADAETVVQAHLVGRDGGLSLEYVSGTPQLPQVADWIKAAVAAQMDYDFETEELRAAANGGDASARVTLRTRGAVSPRLRTFLRIPLDAGYGGRLWGIP